MEKQRTVNANGLSLPALGQGGWNIGDIPAQAQAETRALLRGLELGLTLIDTAEMYGNGRSERLIGNALKGARREDYQLVSKVLPHNAGKRNIFQSCEDSLKRLQTDYLDLYLLHWRGPVPLRETVECMETLVSQGKIRRWGVSNFDTADMEELWRIPGGQNCAADQVLYNLGSRGIEFDLLPWLAQHGVAAMAYCPIAQGGTLERMHPDFFKSPALAAAAQKYGVTVFQVLLAFTLRRPDVISIPKAGNPKHTEANAAVLSLYLSDDDWAAIDAEYWPPTAKMHLDIEQGGICIFKQGFHGIGQGVLRDKTISVRLRRRFRASALQLSGKDTIGYAIRAFGGRVETLVLQALDSGIAVDAVRACGKHDAVDELWACGKHDAIYTLRASCKHVSFFSIALSACGVRIFPHRFRNTGRAPSPVPAIPPAPPPAKP